MINCNGVQNTHAIEMHVHHTESVTITKGYSIENHADALIF